MTRIAPAQPKDFAPRLSKGPGLLQRLRQRLARIDAAMAGQARRTALDPDALRDSGLAPDDLTGAPSHDTTLPFFLQAGFRRHER